MTLRPLALLVFAALLGACGGATTTGGSDGAPTEVADPAQAGWTDLFDGATLDGWHGYATADRSPKWSVVDGVMTLTPDGGDWDADLVAPGGPYADFELEVEWQVAACGNSGLFYRGVEDPALAPIWRTSLEAQILDDTCNDDGRYPSHRAGSLYDLYAAAPGAARPGGTWNTTRIVADGPRITHVLNGQTVVEAVQGSADWDARVAVSKFRDGDAFPGYGTRRAGLVGLQDHGDTLRVRAVRIRTL